jgi:hypothetical protein
MNARNPRNDLHDFTDLWVTPRNGRVVFDEHGNSVWQWPTSDDPFSHARTEEMTAAELRVVEPSEFRRSRLPWVYDRERPAKEFHAVVIAAAKKYAP